MDFFFFPHFTFQGKECMPKKHQLNRTEQALRQGTPNLNNRLKKCEKLKVMDK